MAAIARNQDIGRTQCGKQDQAQYRRHQSQRAHPSAPHRGPKPASQKQREGPAAHGRQGGHRARHRRGPVRQRQQQFERFARQPPQRCAQSSQIEQQGQCDQRHRNESGQRDRNDIGQRPINPCAVEVEQPDRHQRRLNHHPCQQQHGKAAQAPLPPWPLGRGMEDPKRPSPVQRDNRDHRGEAHLKAWAHQRFGPGEQHDEGRHRNHPHRQRLAAQRQRGEHQHRADARADRRHFGPGQQGIADPGQGPARRRQQRQPHPQRQPRDQPQQPQRQDIGRGDHRTDVQPADRQQVREPGIAHRFFVGFGNRPAVTASKCCGDRPG